MVIVKVPIDYVNFSNVREAWIKAKYVERKFVKKLPDITERCSRLSLMEVRKWSVRRLRRRPRSSDGIRKTKIRGSKYRDRNSILMFGNDLDKPLDESIDLSSDQDSTGGEDNDTPGNEEFT